MRFRVWFYLFAKVKIQSECIWWDKLRQTSSSLVMKCHYWKAEQAAVHLSFVSGISHPPPLGEDGLQQDGHIIRSGPDTWHVMGTKHFNKKRGEKQEDGGRKERWPPGMNKDLWWRPTASEQTAQPLLTWCVISKHCVWVTVFPTIHLETLCYTAPHCSHNLGVRREKERLVP